MSIDKESVVNFDPSYDGMFKDKLLVCRTSDMTREELDFFADRMRIERNSYLIQKETVEEEVEELKQEIEDLKNQYHFEIRNKHIEIEVLKNENRNNTNK